MPRPEQERIAAAIMKMRENDDGVPGSSQYFRLAVLHGGMPPLSEHEYPEYCAHRRECFPNWHRPYLIDFERTMRRADIALGGDGSIGLPYWDWIETTINGEVLPAIVRDVLMEEFPADFFPVAPNPGRHGYRMATTRSDAAIKARLEGSSVADDALACLRSTAFRQLATTRFSTSRNVSLESPHNSVHGIVSGIMASFQSSFHPVFWMHHNNVERIFTAYLEQNPDSLEEFRDNQRGLPPNGQRGFPEGPWGPYLPFTHPFTGDTFHAKDSFAPSRTLGFAFDRLPDKPRPQLREPPFLALFQGIDVRKLLDKGPRVLYVYVVDKDAGPVGGPLPSGADEVAMTSHANFANLQSIFFLDTPAGCDNCKDSPIFDEEVDVTSALRRLQIHPSKAELVVLVEASDGSVEPIARTQVPPPVLCGPSLVGSALRAEPVESAAERGAKVASMGLANDGGAQALAKSPYAGRVEVSYRVLAHTLASPLRAKQQGVVADLSAAFAPWEAATGLDFVLKDADDESADITLSFVDRTSANKYRFDGPGGALAHATASLVEFDLCENWLLQGEVQETAQDGADFWDEVPFYLLPVAIHEIGHCLGLGHSEGPSDVMAPYYRTAPGGVPIPLSAADIHAARSLLGK